MKEETSPRNRLHWTPQQMVETLNPMIQGWRNYYGSIDPKVSNRFLNKVDWYISKRLILYWRKKHKRNRLPQNEVAQMFALAGLKRVSGYGSYNAQGEEHRKAVCGKTARTV